MQGSEEVLSPLAFTRQEISFVRSELSVRLGERPRLVDGIVLRSWKAGPARGSPRMPAAVQSLVSRGLLVVRQTHPGQPFRAFWTDPGLQALLTAIEDPRTFDGATTAQLTAELDGVSCSIGR